MKGTWDSIHVVEVQESSSNAHYKLTSTVMLSIETETDATGTVTLSGNLTRQVRVLESQAGENLIVFNFSKKMTTQLVMIVLMYVTLVEWLKKWNTS